MRRRTRLFRLRAFAARQWSWLQLPLMMLMMLALVGSQVVLMRGGHSHLRHVVSHASISSAIGGAGTVLDRGPSPRPQGRRTFRSRGRFTPPRPSMARTATLHPDAPPAPTGRPPQIDPSAAFHPPRAS